MLTKIEREAPKVALFIRSLAGSGAERVVVNLANGLAAGGYRVQLVLGEAAGPFLADVSPGIEVFDLAVGRKTAVLDFARIPGRYLELRAIAKASRAGRIMLGVPRLARYIDAEHPDVLISALDHGNVAAVMAAELSARKPDVVVTQHCNLTSDVITSRRQPGEIYKLVKRYYPAASAIVGVSQGVSDDLKAHIPSAEGKITTIYNPVVDEDLVERAKETPDHPWFSSAPSDTPLIVTVGKLKKQKDHATLLHALARLRRNIPARLVIFGEGPERGRLEELAQQLGIADVVSLPGFAANPLAAMAQADLFVLSSIYEGLPTVLIEALACGCPVVSTDCPSGPAEILEQGRYGPLVPVGDDAALADGMQAVLQNRPDNEVLKTRGHLFTTKRAVDCYGQLVERLKIV